MLLFELTLGLIVLVTMLEPLPLELVPLSLKLLPLLLLLLLLVVLLFLIGLFVITFVGLLLDFAKAKDGAAELLFPTPFQLSGFELREELLFILLFVLSFLVFVCFEVFSKMDVDEFFFVNLKTQIAIKGSVL